MAEFRQLYAPPGMSSNFLAMYLLWGGDTRRRDIGNMLIEPMLYLMALIYS